jgi:hypothetical protein
LRDNLHDVNDVASSAVKKETKKFTDECLAGLKRAQQLRPEIVKNRPRTVEGTLVAYNELLTSASATNALAGLMSEVHPDEAIRDAARGALADVRRSGRVGEIAIGVRPCDLFVVVPGHACRIVPRMPR